MKGVRNFSINKSNKGLLKTLAGGIIFFFILTLINFFASSIKNSFYTFSYPLQKTFWTAGESSSLFLGSFLNAGFLAKENNYLKQENQKLLSQVASLWSIERGNQAQFDFALSCQDRGFKILMASVIGLDDNDMLSIDKGSADGISEGMPVVNQQNVLFGKVFKVYKNFSNVMLVSNKNSVVNVKIQNSEGVILTDEVDGVVKGKGGLNAYLDLIPIDSDINSQDVLVTSSIEKSFPKNLLVAKITQKEKNDQRPFQEASIDLFFDVKTVNDLFVITNYKQIN